LAIVRVKICGITREQDIHRAVRYGADAIGLVYGYSEAKRNIASLKALKRLVDAVPPYASSVVVSRVSNDINLFDLVSYVRPAFLQLDAGEESDGTWNRNQRLIRELRKETGFQSIIQTVRIEGGAPKQRSQKEVIESRIIQKCKAVSCSSKAILLDSKKRVASDGNPLLLGGTGFVHDWQLSRKIREALAPKPVILAGGLTNLNVAKAIRVVKPYAVDVSSGVEAENKPGLKDPNKMRNFIEIAKKTSY